MQLDDMKQLVESVYSAQAQGDEEKMFDLGTDVMEIYLEALSDVHFGGMKTDWLNDIVGAIDKGDGAGLIAILEEEEDVEDRLLGSQIAAMFAGFRQRDSMMTLAQAVGIKALLEEM